MNFGHILRKKNKMGELHIDIMKIYFESDKLISISNHNYYIIRKVKSNEINFYILNTPRNSQDGEVGTYWAQFLPCVHQNYNSLQRNNQGQWPED